MNMVVVMMIVIIIMRKRLNPGVDNAISTHLTYIDAHVPNRVEFVHAE
jgi:hypothetical protein